MGQEGLVQAILGAAVFIGVLFMLKGLFRAQARHRESREGLARRGQLFHLHREHLEAKFASLGTRAERYGAPRWMDAEFEDEVTYARDRQTGALAAYVGVTLRFDLCDARNFSQSADAFDVDMTSCHGTAVFPFRDGRWVTDGQVILNATPVEAVYLLHRNLERLDEEPSRRSSSGPSVSR